MNHKFVNEHGGERCDVCFDLEDSIQHGGVLMLTIARIVLIAVIMAITGLFFFGAIPKARAGDQPFVTTQVQAWYQSISKGGACQDLQHSYRVRILKLTEEYALIEVIDRRPHEILGRPPIDPGAIFKIEAKGVVWNAGNPTEYNLLFTNNSGSVACLVPKSTV